MIVILNKNSRPNLMVYTRDLYFDIKIDKLKVNMWTKLDFSQKAIKFQNVHLPNKELQNTLNKTKGKISKLAITLEDYKTFSFISDSIII